MKALEGQKSAVEVDTGVVASLGMILSEKRTKVETSASIPTSAWWTGGPDSQVDDPDT